MAYICLSKRDNWIINPTSFDLHPLIMELKAGQRSLCVPLWWKGWQQNHLEAGKVSTTLSFVERNFNCVTIPHWFKILKKLFQKSTFYQISLKGAIKYIYTSTKPQREGIRVFKEIAHFLYCNIFPLFSPMCINCGTVWPCWKGRYSKYLHKLCWQCEILREIQFALYQNLFGHQVWHINGSPIWRFNYVYEEKSI